MMRPEDKLTLDLKVVFFLLRWCWEKFWTTIKYKYVIKNIVTNTSHKQQTNEPSEKSALEQQTHCSLKPARVARTVHKKSFLRPKQFKLHNSEKSCSKEWRSSVIHPSKHTLWLWKLLSVAKLFLVLSSHFK